MWLASPTFKMWELRLSTHRSKEKREEEMSGESKGVPIPDSLHESTRNWQLVHLHGFHGDRSFGRESKGVKD